MKSLNGPLRVGIGGTLPISAMARQALGLETVTLSYAVADENIAIPQSASVESLNAGVAASIVLYEAARQRARVSL